MKFVSRNGEYVAEHLGEIIHTAEELDDLLDNFMPSDYTPIDPPESDTDTEPDDFFN